jgi:magnesium chelatase subunit D
MAKKAAGAGIQTLVIDTENKFVSTGFAEEIAKAANGGGLEPALPGAAARLLGAAARLLCARSCLPASAGARR